MSFVKVKGILRQHLNLNLNKSIQVQISSKSFSSTITITPETETESGVLRRRVTGSRFSLYRQILVDLRLRLRLQLQSGKYFSTSSTSSTRRVGLTLKGEGEGKGEGKVMSMSTRNKNKAAMAVAETATGTETETEMATAKSPLVTASPAVPPAAASATVTAKSPLVKAIPPAGKRKASSTPEPIGTINGTTKKAKVSDDNHDLSELRQPHHSAKEAEEYGIVLRKYYPHEMCNPRAIAYNNNELPRPIELLHSALEETKEERTNVPGKDSVVHWFKCDLRTKDNKALRLASEKAMELGVPLIAMYVISPQDFEAHLTAPVRVDFILRTLEILKGDLVKLDIPLYVETVEKRQRAPGRILELLEEWGTSHLYANVEYEVDELRREARMVRQCLEKGIAMDVVPDTCVVSPGELASGQGKQYSVYTPWFKTWVAYVHENSHLLDLFEFPGKNPPSARKKFAKLFETKVPDAPANKSLTDEEKKRFHSMWPAGEHAAQERLTKFAKEKITQYQEMRNFPSLNQTSCLSVHFASGTLSARTAIRTARDHNTTKKLNAGHPGIQTWISEVAWRDFYKHVLAHWPYVCMNKPFKPEYTNIVWEYNMSHFNAWTQGKTGYPIVDAAMRQLNYSGYMHNRCRMIVGSFLAKHLLIDWRMGEKYFMEHLIDGDFASNNGGWGFSASTGVDPQPYFRIFNPLLQSEKFDKQGTYIRKWVEELRGVEGKAVHEPFADGKASGVARERGYPERIVEHKGSRERCLGRYKEGLGKGK
ncbi:cryptochrome DASH [Sclerotinia borealis F-4128]|uniref:Cryptochrome DASH n=1 Tax=Sclerotinia borealis (strain F-4128) TaxID=1432307 RepID=W9BZP7_SCLBF|nr:cryptochrome DASH [Sclerotinia borealis F-4128]